MLMKSVLDMSHMYYIFNVKASYQAAIIRKKIIKINYNVVRKKWIFVSERRAESTQQEDFAMSERPGVGNSRAAEGASRAARHKNMFVKQKAGNCRLNKMKNSVY